MVGSNDFKYCLEDVSNNKLNSQSMANTTDISINCISPPSSSNETGSSEEDDVVDTDENLRV